MGVVLVLAIPVVMGVMGGLHWYVWRRIVRDTTTPGTVWRRLGTVVLVAGPALMLTVFTGDRLGLPFQLVRIVAWPAYLWAAVALYLLIGVIAGEAVRPALAWLLWRHAAQRPAAVPAPASEPVAVPDDAPASAPVTAAPDAPDGDAPADLSRRLFVARLVGGAAAAVAVGTVGHGTYGVLRGPRVKRVTVPLAKLPRSAHGFRIAVVSDVHLGPILGRGFTERVVATVNATQPDLIAVVGDLVDGSVDDLRSAVEPISGLQARHGAFFVTGNHEYFSGVEEWTAHVRELGLKLLANERVELAPFDLAGVNDVTGEDHDDGPDLTAALEGRDPSRTSVLLAHQPVFVDEAVRHGVDLQLSGHTHGGQLWPMNYVAELANPTVAGLERYGDTQLYVSRGAGAWGPPTRVGAPSDVTVVELASGQA
ncbi:metallophosphoesterase [Streptomyces ipomoeae]|uniref:Ser/Thr phosphatase family protein n=2 Tax=Streptomyces ipomoeae TaxID=103232 RepID=L1KRK6_9ACTN|nr:metallophosphoesterase [Streptomyces ipomoeae]EKX63008.1 Ser/Thr phosphatase family protein [Streptomyces ipomoeae 91-03]MDX2692808.1 metallophosphoesterase [Streptomyces ipomoeae]TQE27904.1 metallophosphoesterase [Streptomyces ipomoeae]